MYVTLMRNIEYGKIMKNKKEFVKCEMHPDGFELRKPKTVYEQVHTPISSINNYKKCSLYNNGCKTLKVFHIDISKLSSGEEQDNTVNNIINSMKKTSYMKGDAFKQVYNLELNEYKC